MTKLTPLFYRGERVYLPSHVSVYLEKANFYVTTMICNGKLTEGEDYFQLEKQDIENLLKENKTFIWGRGRMKYFITESGLDKLKDITLRGYNSILSKPNSVKKIKLKTGDKPILEKSEIEFVIEGLESEIEKSSDETLSNVLKRTLKYLQKEKA